MTQQKQPAPLTIASFRLEKNGLVPLGNPTFDNWLSCGRFLKNAEKSVQFWIGDWLLYGEKHFGKTDYEQAVQETGFEYQTLRDYKWVAGAIPLSLRNDKLGFHHHRAVASLTQDEQTQLLDKAVAEEWSLVKLKHEKYRSQLEQARSQPAASASFSTQKITAFPLSRLNALPSQTIDLVITAPSFAGFSPTTLTETLAILSEKIKINSHLYIFCNRFEYPLLLPALQHFFTVKNLLVYEKQPGPALPSSPFLPVYEFILFAQKGRRHLNGRRDSSVFRWTASLPAAPSEKPVGLLEYLIEKSSQVGEVVCDPFAGGTPVGEAAKNTGRQFVGVKQEEIS